ncbi:MAG: protein kinase domain-containing protein [Phycisphaerae bacterium]
MNAERFKLIDELFNQVRNLALPDRDAALARACGQDADLRREVEALLTFDDKPQAYLRTPVLKAGMQFTMGGIAAAPWQKSFMPERVGAYRIIRVIGEGGFGVVYLAEQENPRRTVALKVMKPHLSSPQMFKRFEYEAQVLARLQHPGIAQIYEAGTSTGAHGTQAFFALEYIEGKSLDAFVRENGLNITQRLELFARVCDAVQYAHQRGVIHRDLKPANILVPDDTAEVNRVTSRSGGVSTLGGVGSATSASCAPQMQTRVPDTGQTPNPWSTGSYKTQPKILDFGVSKVLDADMQMTTLRTSTGQFIGTLPYMSPEQVSGDQNDLDTRSDVYSLGVILYQILAGQLPFDFRSCSVPEAARRIRDDDAARLGTINRAYRGEVETIVAKALMKDKRRRYQSAAELAADIRRYLAGEPIEAKRDSTLYVIRKQLRRYWTLATAAAIFVALLGWFGVYATLQSHSFRELAIREIGARDEAVKALDVARQQRMRADRTAERLEEQLAESNIERGRLYGQTGVTNLAEEYIWPHHLTNPGSLHTYWALWDLYATDPWLWTKQAHSGQTQHVRFARDDATLVSCSNTGEIKFWDTATRNCYFTEFVHAGAVTALELSPDGRFVVTSGRDQRVVMTDLETCERVAELPGHVSEASHVAVDPAGRLLATCGWDDNIIRLWRLPELELSCEYVTHWRGSHSVAFSPDGRTLAVGCRDNFIRLLTDVDHVPMEALAMRLTNGGPGRMLFSADGGKLYTAGGDRVLRVYDVETGQRVRERQCPNDTISRVFYSPDGRHLMTNGWWSLNFWDRDSETVIRTLIAPEGATSTDMSRDGHFLAIGGVFGSIRIRQLDASDAVFRAEGSNSRSVARLSPDGRVLAVGDNRGMVRLWNVDERRQIGQWQAHPGRIYAIRFDPRGGRILTGSVDAAIRLWNLDTLECIQDFGPSYTRTNSAIDWSDDGRWFGFMGSDSALHVVDAETLVERNAFFTDFGEMLSLRFSRDAEHIATVNRGSGAKIFTRDGRLLNELSREGQQWTCAFSPDNTVLAMGTWGWNVQLFDWRTGDQIGTLPGHTSTVWAVDFHPHDSRLVTSISSDGTARLHDIEEQRTLITFNQLSGTEVLSVHFSSDGSRLCAANSVGSAIVWELDYFRRHVLGQVEFQAHRRRNELGDRMSPARLNLWREAIEHR